MEHSRTVHIVEDDASIRAALARLLGAAGYTVHTYDSASAFLATLNDERGGCILLDVDMPGMSGVELQERLGLANCLLPIVFLTGQGDIATSVRTIKAGAEDFLCKPVGVEPLIDAIERALARYRKQAGALSHRRALARRFNSLTAREREVFELLITGALNKQVADKLGNTERTVKAHRRSIMDKLGVRSVAELVHIAGQLAAR